MDIKEENIEKESSNSLSFLEQPAGYHANEEYVADIIKIFHLLERPGNQTQALACMQYLDKCVERSAPKIAFEKELKKYNLSIVEKFCLLKLIYVDLFGAHYTRFTVRDLFQFVINTKLCQIEQAVRMILQSSATIYKQGLVLCNNGSISLRRNLIDLFINGKGSNPRINRTDKLPRCSILSIYKGLNRFIIGQEQPKQDLASCIYEHFLRCKIAQEEGRTMEKNNILLIGPTGTGKTYLCRILAQILQIPFYMADASQMTDTGYVGPSVDSVLINLRKQIPNMGSVFPPAIVYLDEIDKLAFKDTANDVSGRRVQEELLKLLESTVYTTAADKFREVQQYDISNIMFIAGGAFAGIENIVLKRMHQHQIGFGAPRGKENVSHKVTPCDLEAYGFMPELIGRFSHISQLSPLTEQNLVDILSKAKNNPLEQYKRIFNEAGINLCVPRKVLAALAQQALTNQTGARGLKTVLSTLLSKALFDCNLHKKKKYTLSLRE